MGSATDDHPASQADRLADTIRNLAAIYVLSLDGDDTEADPASAEFDPRRYWRGPSWPVVNALMAIGLKDRGHQAAAERLRRETAELIAAHGFFEYFDPIDGTPCGGDAFTWTAAIWLTWAGSATDTKGGA